MTHPEGRHSAPTDRYAPPLEVVCAVIIERGAVLLAQRGLTKSHPGLWEFVGGKVEKDETAFEALVREVHEELSLDIEPLDQLEPVLFVNDQGRQINLIPIRARIIDGDPVLSADHQSVRWVCFPDVMTLPMAYGDTIIAQRIASQYPDTKL